MPICQGKRGIVGFQLKNRRRWRAVVFRFLNNLVANTYRGNVKSELTSGHGLSDQQLDQYRAGVMVHLRERQAIRLVAARMTGRCKGGYARSLGRSSKYSSVFPSVSGGNTQSLVFSTGGMD